MMKYVTSIFGIQNSLFDIQGYCLTLISNTEYPITNDEVHYIDIRHSKFFIRYSTTYLTVVFRAQYKPQGYRAFALKKFVYPTFEL